MAGDLGGWPWQNTQVLWSMAKLCWKSLVRGELSPVKVPTEPSWSPLGAIPEYLWVRSHAADCFPKHVPTTNRHVLTLNTLTNPHIGTNAFISWGNSKCYYTIGRQSPVTLAVLETYWIISHVQGVHTGHVRGGASGELLKRNTSAGYDWTTNVSLNRGACLWSDRCQCNRVLAQSCFSIGVCQLRVRQGSYRCD